MNIFYFDDGKGFNLIHEFLWNILGVPFLQCILCMEYRDIRSPVLEFGRRLILEMTSRGFLIVVTCRYILFKHDDHSNMP